MEMSRLTGRDTSKILEAASKTGHRRVVEFLLRSEEVPHALRTATARTIKKPRVVCSVASAGSAGLSLMQLLLEQRASVAGADPGDGPTPLIAAVSSYDGGLAMVKLLEQRGAPVTDPSLLESSAESGHVAILRYLLQRQSDEGTVAIKVSALNEALIKAP